MLNISNYDSPRFAATVGTGKFVIKWCNDYMRHHMIASDFYYLFAMVIKQIPQLSETSHDWDF